MPGRAGEACRLIFGLHRGGGVEGGAAQRASVG